MISTTSWQADRTWIHRKALIDSNNRNHIKFEMEEEDVTMVGEEDGGGRWWGKKMVQKVVVSVDVVVGAAMNGPWWDGHGMVMRDKVGWIRGGDAGQGEIYMGL